MEYDVYKAIHDILLGDIVEYSSEENAVIDKMIRALGEEQYRKIVDGEFGEAMLSALTKTERNLWAIQHRKIPTKADICESMSLNVIYPDEVTVPLKRSGIVTFGDVSRVSASTLGMVVSHTTARQIVNDMLHVGMCLVPPKCNMTWRAESPWEHIYVDVLVALGTERSSSVTSFPNKLESGMRLAIERLRPNHARYLYAKYYSRMSNKEISIKYKMKGRTIEDAIRKSIARLSRDDTMFMLEEGRAFSWWDVSESSRVDVLHISDNVVKLLHQADIHTVMNLVTHDEYGLRSVPYLCAKHLCEINQALSEAGLCLSEGDYA